MSLAAYTWGKMLEALAHNVTWTAGETWVALFDENGIELSNVDYARQRVEPTGGASPVWSPVIAGANASRIENNGAISWGNATVIWGIVKSAGLYDAVTSGTRLMFEDLASERTVLIGDPFQIPDKQFKIRMKVK